MSCTGVTSKGPLLENLLLVGVTQHSKAMGTTSPGKAPFVGWLIHRWASGDTSFWSVDNFSRFSVTWKAFCSRYRTDRTRVATTPLSSVVDPEVSRCPAHLNMNFHIVPHCHVTTRLCMQSSCVDPGYSAHIFLKLQAPSTRSQNCQTHTQDPRWEKKC